MGGELATAAVCYATPFVVYQKEKFANSIHFEKVRMSEWRLSLNYKGNVLKDNHDLSPEERIRQLAKAGALIAAEIDRIQRLKSSFNK